MAAHAAIEATGLEVKAGKSTLLDGIDLRVAAGEWVSIIGPNGAGKSTLLRAVGGVVASAGRLRVFGHDNGDLDRRRRAKLVAWVPQTPTIPPGISVLDYVLLGRTPHLGPFAREGAGDLAIVEEVLGELDLTEFAGRDVDTLSGGELQRAVIGRALAQQTPLVLLDEPTSALDLGHQQDLLGLLDDLRASGRCTIVTTMHDLTLAGVFADRLVMLDRGRVVAEGTAVEVLTEQALESCYGAAVSVTVHDGRVTVVPRLGERRPVDRSGHPDR